MEEEDLGQRFPDQAADENHVGSSAKTQLSNPGCGHSDPDLWVGARKLRIEIPGWPWRFLFGG